MQYVATDSARILNRVRAVFSTVRNFAVLFILTFSFFRVHN
jgi:hypothetical protein